MCKKVHSQNRVFFVSHKVELLQFDTNGTCCFYYSGKEDRVKVEHYRDREKTFFPVAPISLAFFLYFVISRCQNAAQKPRGRSPGFVMDNVYFNFDDFVS